MQNTNRGLFPDPNQCLYFVDFVGHNLASPTGLFPILLMEGCSWHYKEGNPFESYFEKNGAQFPIGECSLQHIEDTNSIVVLGNPDHHLVVGLAHCPSDAECLATLNGDEGDDEGLLQRKKENQANAQMKGGDHAAGL